MTAESLKGRANWQRMSPEVRASLTELAFRGDDTITPEMKEVLQDNAIQDELEKNEGENDD